jgi:hypothetical protein
LALTILSARSSGLGDCRGFIVHTNRINYVITAAHVLPSTPPAHPGRGLKDESYPKLIGPRNAEPALPHPACSPIQSPTSPYSARQPGAHRRARTYEAFTAQLAPFNVDVPPPDSRLPRVRIRDAPLDFVPHTISVPGYVLSLEGTWIDCHAAYYDGPFWVKPEEIVVRGMSGSPLINTSGAAMGVINTSNMAACLIDALPGRLLRALACGWGPMPGGIQNNTMPRSRACRPAGS